MKIQFVLINGNRSSCRIIFPLLFLILFITGMGYTQIIDTVMVTVPAGEFVMGCNYNEPDLPCMESTYPAHTVYVDEFKMDKYMVTYRRYNKCVAAGACTPLYEGGGCNARMPWNTDHPVNCVDYNQAVAFCEWDGGKRLPTEAEWGKAARGTDGRIFPWGNELATCEYAVMNDQPFVDGVMGPGCGNGYTQPVGSRPKGASPYGAMDMAGNLWEWTQDWYSDDYFANSPYENPKGPDSGTLKVLKGSDWAMRTPVELAANIRFGYALLGQGYLVGFRCVKSSDDTSVGAILQNDSFELLQNYPNPFNPSTKIEYATKSTGNVKINIFDSTGKLVKMLVNDTKAPGNYSIEWNGKDVNGSPVSSGTYFYQIHTGDFVSSKKMILLR